MIVEQSSRKRNAGPGCDAAANYVMHVKQRLGCEEQYSQFIEILRQYQQARSQKRAAGGMLLDAALVLEVNEKVAALFAQYPDLLEGFRLFLPDAAMMEDPGAKSSHEPECSVLREGSALC